MTPPVPGFLGRILDEAGGPAGTCFQAAPGLLVTAWHVLDGLGKAAAGDVVGVDLLAGGETFAAHVLATDPGHDLAVLRSAGEFPSSVTGFAATDTVPGRTEVTIAGAGEVDDPGHSYRFITATGTWQEVTLRDDDVSLGRCRSVDVLPGMSGAPVRALPDGTVVGVVSGRYNSADGWLAHSVWVSRTEYLAELMPAALIDLSTRAAAWRERRTAFREAMAYLARNQLDAFLVGNSGPPLVAAYVREVVPGTKAGDRAPVPATEVLAASDDGGVWLVGGPGYGKSRLLRSWTIELAREQHRIPVLLRARDLVTAVGSPVGPVPVLETVAAAVGAGLGSVGRDGIAGLAEWFAGAPADVEWVVLIDGLDEVADERLRTRVFTVVARLSELAWRCRVVVASRPPVEGDNAGTGWRHTRYDLLGLDAGQRDEFVRGWFPDLGVADADRAARDFVADLHRRGLHELARIPLMLVILAQLGAYDADSALPASRVEAYERIVEETHRRRSRGPGAASEIHDWHDEHLPRAVAELHDRLGGVDGLLSRLAFERFRGTAESAVDWVGARTEELRLTTRLSPRHWRVIVREALRDSRLLVAHGDDFEFVHATLHEFFAARHLARDHELSTRLLESIFGPRGERFIATSGRWRPELVDPDRAHRVFPFTDWVFAHWSEWAPFTDMLSRLVRTDADAGCTYVANLAWRWVRLNSHVLETVRTKLRTLMAESDAEAAVVVADLLAMARDPAGIETLAGAVADPRLGFARISAARRLIAHGDPRGPDLLAEVVEAVVTAPEPARFTDREAEARRLALEDLARRGHPRASELLERFLLDPRTDDGRTRRYTYAMLGYDVETHSSRATQSADLLTRLWAELPASDELVGYHRSKDLDRLLAMTDPGCADRLARVAGAAATMPVPDRGKAAVRLAELDDPRAAGLLAAVLADHRPDDSGGDDDEYGGGDDVDIHLDVAWALARLGDSRATPALIASAEHAKFWLWERQVKAAATNGEPATADILLELSTAPGVPAWARADALRWLTLTGDPRGTELTAQSTSDPGLTGFLVSLADALARRRDRRFTALLARWADEHCVDKTWASYEGERAWAARILAAPEQVLGSGLLADFTTIREVSPFGRLLTVDELFHTDHPRAMDCLLALHRELESRPDPDRGDDRWQVVLALARRGSLAAVPSLARRVRDATRSESDRKEALTNLTTLDGPVVADTLVELAPEVHRGGQHSIAFKLRAMGDPRTGHVLAYWLIEELRNSPYDRVDWRLHALLDHRDPQLVTVLDHVVTQHFAGYGGLDPRHAIDDAARTGPAAADLLARWAMDSRFTTEQRIAAVHALAGVAGERAAEVHERLLADPGLTPEARQRARDAGAGEQPPRSQLEALLQYFARR